jgi:hypothetical protein
MKLKDAVPSQSSVGTPKSKYTRPRLVVFGSVGTLTKGTGGSNPDTGQSAPTKKGSG